jgi:hypothetical protein
VHKKRGSREDELLAASIIGKMSEKGKLGEGEERKGRNLETPALIIGL